MNIENLKEGMVVKNYRKLCNLLGEKIKGGDSKKAQLKDWEEYFEYEREGYKYIITKIKNIDDALQFGSEERRIMRNIEKGKYSKDVYPIVKNFVSNYENEYIIKSKILEMLGFINSNYSLAFENPKKFIKLVSSNYDKDISEESVNIIVNSIYTVSHEKIHNAFTNLEKLGYIYSYTNKLLMVFYNNKDFEDRLCIPTSDEEKIINKCIFEGKLKALSNYYCRVGKSMTSYVELVKLIEEDCKKDIDEMNKRLNVELFLRGLGKEAHNLSLTEIKRLNMFNNLSNFFYAYGYIRNEDLEWEKEIIDIAKENIHLDNYKETVKEAFVLDKFLEKWFDNTHNTKTKDGEKYKFRREFNKFKKSATKEVEFLFDILTSKDKILK